MSRLFINCIDGENSWDSILGTHVLSGNQMENSLLICCENCFVIWVFIEFIESLLLLTNDLCVLCAVLCTEHWWHSYTRLLNSCYANSRWTTAQNNNSSCHTNWGVIAINSPESKILSQQFQWCAVLYVFIPCAINFQ